MEKVSETRVGVELLPDIQDVVLHQARSWRPLFWQLVRFCLVGVINAAVDTLMLNILLLRFPTHNANTLLLYNSVAFTLGALNSYLLNKYWTFQRGRAIRGGEVLRFVALSVISFLVSDGIIWTVARLLHPLIANVTLWANISKLSAVGVTAIVSYFGMRLWVFADTPQQCAEKCERKAYALPKTDLLGQPPAGYANALPETDLLGQPPAGYADEPDDEYDWTQPRIAVSKFRTKRSLSVVLPAYNEEEVIAETIHETISTLIPWVQDFELICVNDGSRDATGTILDAIAAANPRVLVIHHPVNRGYGAALVSGFEAAEKDLTFFMDSDGQFDIRDLERFFPLIEQYDAVLGYRIDRQDTWMRKLNAWGWKMLVGRAFGVSVRDVDCAFKLYRGNFFREHRLETRGAMINTEMIYKFTRAGYSYTQVGVRHQLRRGGRATGARPSVILRAFRELFIYARKWHGQAKEPGLTGIFFQEH